MQATHRAASGRVASLFLEVPTCRRRERGTGRPFRRRHGGGKVRVPVHHRGSRSERTRVAHRGRESSPGGECAAGVCAAPGRCRKRRWRRVPRRREGVGSTATSSSTSPRTAVRRPRGMADSRTRPEKARRASPPRAAGALAARAAPHRLPPRARSPPSALRASRHDGGPGRSRPARSVRERSSAKVRSSASTLPAGLPQTARRAAGRRYLDPRACKGGMRRCRTSSSSECESAGQAR